MYTCFFDMESKKKKKGKHHVSLIRKHIFISMLGNKSEITYTKAKKKKKDE